MKVGTCLHVGCGTMPLPSWLQADQEIRVDSDPSVQPDLVTDMRDLSKAPQVDMVYCHHALEHLSKHDGVLALQEFRRVLKPNRMAVVVVPDLEDIRPTDEVVYVSPAGPVTGADMYWGMQSLVRERPFMRHQFGYTKSTLEEAFRKAGFSKVEVQRTDGWELLAMGAR